MRRSLGYLVAWVLVTAISAAAAWWGIRSVLVAAATDRTTPLSAAELRQAAGPTPGTVGATTDKPPPTATPSPAPRRTVPPSPTASPGTDRWELVPAGNGATAYRRTLVVTGGVAVVWCAVGDVRVLTVTANRGYTVREDRYDPQTILVSFLSANHTSRIYAAWRDGPVAELTESVT